MKKILFCLTAISIILASCSKDDDDPGFSFVDQNLQGVIGGSNWTFVSGSGEDSFFTEGNLSIDLYPEQLETPCGFLIGVDKVMFDIPKEVGIHKLYLDLSNGKGFTVTLLQAETMMNNIAIQGAVEIMSIDTASKKITGRMDVIADSENKVNGNFEVTYCME